MVSVFGELIGLEGRLPHCYQLGKVSFDILIAVLTSGVGPAASAFSKATKVLIKGTKKAQGILRNILQSPSDLVKALKEAINKAPIKAPDLYAKMQVYKTGCFIKNTPVLIARDITNLDHCQNEASPVSYERDFRESRNSKVKNGAKTIALAAAMPIITIPIQDVQLLDYAAARKTVNTNYGMVALVEHEVYTGLMDKDPYISHQQRLRDRYELNDESWHEVVFEELYGSSIAKLALHQDWMHQHGYTVDAIVHINLPEQGISGPFRITAIKHILPPKETRIRSR